MWSSRRPAVASSVWLDRSLWVPCHCAKNPQRWLLFQFLKYLWRSGRKLQSTDATGDDLLGPLTAGLGMDLHAGDMALPVEVKLVVHLQVMRRVERRDNV